MRIFSGNKPLTPLRTLGALLVTVITVGLLAPPPAADAQRRRRRAAPRVQRSAEIAPALNGMSWGWSRQRLLRYLRGRVDEAYADRLRTAPGAIEEDAVRTEMGREVRRIMNSYFQFNGTVSGHDSSILRGEFTHRNQEAMMVYRAERSTDYYFFIQNRLWKRYEAFHRSVFEGVSFEEFGAALEGRFGPAQHREGNLYPDYGRETRWYEWTDGTTRLRAIDNGRSFALSFEEIATVNNLDTLRPNRPQVGDRGHALVDAVTSGDPADAVVDNHSDVADRITGEQRNRGE